MALSARKAAPSRRKAPASSPHASRAALREMQEALERGEFVYDYQPKVSMISGRLSGAEALLRWRRRDGSTTYPGDFIPLAESSGFITEITTRMLPRLAEDVARLRAVRAGLVVSFNASARDFEAPRFVAALFRLFDRGLLGPAEIEVELTESAALAGKPALVEQLLRLRGRQVAVAMDDFGSGYASVDALSRLPFTSLKLDNGVVRRMHASDKDARIVLSNIRLAHNLGFDVVAEGVESEITYYKLQQSGCSHAQGYWIGRPMPLEAFLAFAAAGQTWPEGVIGMVHMATLDHLEWRKFLLDRLLLFKRLGLALTDDDLRHCQISAAQCRLGHWYDGPGRQLSGLPEYAELGRVHAALHDCARNIFHLLNADATSAQIATSIRTLSEHSVRVIASLQSVEQAILATSLDATK